MNPKQEFEDLLRRHRFELRSANKHYKYVSREGKIFVASKTPSDWRTWRNATARLKQVIRDPLVTSLVVEEERQRRIVEAEIALQKQPKPMLHNGTGNGNAGKRKGAKDPGTGIWYEDVVVPHVPDEVKEAQRNDDHMNRLIHHVIRQRERAQRHLREIYIHAATVTTVMFARLAVAHEYRAFLKEPRNKKLALCESKQTRREARDKVLEQWEIKYSAGRIGYPGKQLFDWIMAGAPEVFKFEMHYDNHGVEATEMTLRIHGAALTFLLALWEASGTAPLWMTPVHVELDRGMVKPLLHYDPPEYLASAWQKVLAGARKAQLKYGKPLVSECEEVAA